MAEKIKLSVQLYQDDNDLMWHFGFHISEEIGKPFIDGSDRRVICTLPDGESFHCALFSAKSGGYNILINKARRERLGLRPGAVIDIHLEKDRSKYGADMSDEFEAVLDSDPEGNRLFHALSPGKQRTLIYFSDNVKNSDIKIRRALTVMRHLEEEEGELDYKRLNEMIKEANRLAKLK